ncbi:FcoT family thioesterase [Aquisphaera insulae]|uniref:FcoT family thioesterase n=1 Tax=Aquisphaera insulae TaxID=2712864 RepID=UPI00196A2573|nr:FcoT family thioesterase [Aquisphaera insulae]
MNNQLHLAAGVETMLAPDFLDRVLGPYRPNCRYLRAARAEFDGVPGWESLVIRGEFAIDASCYIDDTGHFNAVEFNICYNQLAYVHLAHCIRHGLMPALLGYDLQGFHRLQLSNFLIANINSSYHSPLSPRRFSGEVRVVSAKKRSRFSILRTTCRFRDGADGRSDGEVKLVVLRP